MGFWRFGLFVAFLCAGVAQANDDLLLKFEELVRLEVALLTEVEFNHASGNELPRGIVNASPSEYQRLLIDTSSWRMTSDRMVMTHLNQLKANSLSLLNIWVRSPRNRAALQQELLKVDNAYYNMQAVTRFYLWAMENRPTKYLANIRELANRIQSSILFLRGQQPISYQAQDQYQDNGIQSIPQTGKPQAFPVYVPKEQGKERSYVDGEVIPPNPNALN